MPGKRLSMRKIKEVLRLKFEVGLSGRAIAHGCALGRSTGTLHSPSGYRRLRHSSIPDGQGIR